MLPQTKRYKTQTGSLKTALTIGATLAACLVLVLLTINMQRITDWWRLRGYQPPSSVQQLADQDTMTDYTRHMFYLNRPQLLPSVSSFRKHCPENETTIVLGCYHPGQNGIFVYQVNDPALQGVSQVTAAHEVLHAIYARLSKNDRNQLNSLLNNYYKNGLQDERVKSEIKLYQQTEPKDVLDEMSCTFGTEVADLPAPLENYYRKYFSDRSKIVAYEQQYEAAFTARQSKIKQYDQQLAAIKQQIDSLQSTLTSEKSQLNDAQNQLKAMLASGQTEEYNATVPAYNNRVNQYNDGVADLKQRISQYNQLVQTRNEVASELTTLDKALDTRLSPRN